MKNTGDYLTFYIGKRWSNHQSIEKIVFYKDFKGKKENNHLKVTLYFPQYMRGKRKQSICEGYVLAFSKKSYYIKKIEIEIISWGEIEIKHFFVLKCRRVFLWIFKQFVKNMMVATSIKLRIVPFLAMIYNRVEGHFAISLNFSSFVVTLCLSILKNFHGTL